MAIAVVGMLDEREQALAQIRSCLEANGFETCLMDISIGTGATVPAILPDITAREIAESGLESVKEVAASGAHIDRNPMTGAMAEGLKKKVSALYMSGGLDGIIAIAGMTGTLMALEAMSVLPFGFPKLLLSTGTALPAYAYPLAEYFAVNDIAVIHTVVDTVGMNDLVGSLALNGANAISGMVKGRPGVRAAALQRRPSLAITEFGFCDKGAHYVREMLSGDYEIVSFHAIGLGDKAAANLVRQGLFQAFVDLVPATFSEHILGGNRALGGPSRLDIALDQGIPYIFCPGGFDMISCGPLERRDAGDNLWVSRRLSERKLYVKDRIRVEARTSAEEMAQVGMAAADKLNRYSRKELVGVLIPGKGFSSLSAEGGPLFDRGADEAFAKTLRSRLDPRIDVAEVDANINDPEFAKAVASVLRSVVSRVSTDASG